MPRLSSSFPLNNGKTPPAFEKVWAWDADVRIAHDPTGLGPGCGSLRFEMLHHLALIGQ